MCVHVCVRVCVPVCVHSAGVVSVQDPGMLDYEASPRLRLVLQAESAASFGFLAVQVNLQDVNDNRPRFQLQHYVAFIWEAQGYDSPVIQVLPGGGRLEGFPVTGVGPERAGRRGVVGEEPQPLDEASVNHPEPIVVWDWAVYKLNK